MLIIFIDSSIKINNAFTFLLSYIHTMQKVLKSRKKV